jgi:hypothetical protein
MPILKSLIFTAMPDVRRTPQLHRRLKFVERLQEQKALLANPAHSRTTYRWVEKDGVRVRETRPVKMTRWWSQNSDGKIVLVPRFGLKPIEFERGKPGILLDKESQLSSLLDNLIAATNAGELDQLLARVKPKAA